MMDVPEVDCLGLEELLEIKGKKGNEERSMEDGAGTFRQYQLAFRILTFLYIQNITNNPKHIVRSWKINTRHVFAITTSNLAHYREFQVARLTALKSTDEHTHPREYQDKVLELT
ncbi:hypothetical protein ElyMa_002688300 [Elysia marginata]|uniref:Uncharacterized protein n=1 Tax=Elysia marginata TaxID=1093978 RepID=A0AAV4HAS9_9GAST|nr:hypothetical protein ElyMa_002688300 [Elysia marginata]